MEPETLVLMTSPRAGDRVFWVLRAPTNRPPKTLPGVRLLLPRARLVLTTGTCSVAANVYFALSLRHPLQPVSPGCPHSSPHRTLISECGFNYLFWFGLFQSTSTVFAPFSFRKKLNTGGACFMHLDTPQKTKTSVNCLPYKRLVFSRWLTEARP